MVDYSKLIGKIVEVFGTRCKFAEAANTSPSALSQILTGKRLLDQVDILKWSELLGIPYDEIGLYFFVKKVD